MAHSGKTITFATDLLPNEDNIYNLGSSGQRWKIQGATVTDRLTTTKPINQIITGTGTAATDSGSGDNRYKPAKWTFNLGAAAPVDGDIITIKIPVAGHDYGVFLSTNNGTNYYPVVCNGTGRLTTHYPVNTYITVIFESTGSAASMFALAGGTSRITVSGGVWRVINYYDSNNNDTGYYHRRIYPNLKAGGAIHPYSIIMQLPNGRWSGITTTAPNNPVTGTISPKDTGKAASTSGYVLGHVLVMYARATYADGNNIATYNIWSAHTGLIDARYSFNLANSTGNGFIAYTPVYIVGTVTDGLFYLDTTKWWTQTLPSSDDGKVYIYIGDAYDWYRLTFTEDKPMYWYKNGALRLYAGDAGTVCGLTVQTAVPQNAIFTDTNKYHKTGSWNDLTYTATAVNSADELKFTIPTGTTATTVAVGNHTHSLSIATDTGTNALTFAANTKYKLTAGGNTYIFTTQNDAGKLNQTSLGATAALSSFTDTSALIYTAKGGSNTITDKPTGVDAFGILSFKTADGWYGQLLMSSNTSSGIYWRTGTSLSGGWKTILDSNNTASGTNNAATLTWNTTYTIAKINGTDIKFTTMAKPSYAFTDLTAHPTTLSDYGITDGLRFAGNITSVGSGSPHSGVKTWWENTANVPKLSMVAAYNNSGTEWSFLFSKGNADKTYGSVLRWGYSDRYIYILRKNNASSWLSSDWEKIYAGYADSAGSSPKLANSYSESGRLTDANIAHVNNGGIIHFKATSSMTSNKPMGDGSILHFHWDNSGAWDAQLYVPDATGGSIQYRPSSSAGTWANWRTVLDDNNFNTYLDSSYKIEIIRL